MNPKIIQAVDGTFLLYYTGDTYDGPTPTEPPQPADNGKSQGLQRIGLAYASSITGPWSRLPEPIISPRPGKWDDRMTANRSFRCVEEWHNTCSVQSINSSRISQAKDCLHWCYFWKGPYLRVRDDPIFPCPENSFHFEDPSIWYDQESNTVHMLVKDSRGTVTHAGYSGAHAFSTDNGVTWQFTDPPLAYSTTNMWSDGKRRKQTRMERPEVFLDDNGHVSYVFFATDTGLEGPDWWNMVIPVVQQQLNQILLCLNPTYPDI